MLVRPEKPCSIAQIEVAFEAISRRVRRQCAETERSLLLDKACQAEITHQYESPSGAFSDTLLAWFASIRATRLSK